MLVTWSSCGVLYRINCSSRPQPELRIYPFKLSFALTILPSSALVPLAELVLSVVLKYFRTSSTAVSAQFLETWWPQSFLTYSSFCSIVVHRYRPFFIVWFEPRTQRTIICWYRRVRTPNFFVSNTGIDFSRFGRQLSHIAINPQGKSVILLSQPVYFIGNETIPNTTRLNTVALTR